MIPRRSRRSDPRLVLGPVLALVLPCAGALAQNAPAQVPAGAQPAPARQAPGAPAATQAPAALSAPRQADTEAIKQRDQELDAIRADERVSAENQAKLRREIETIGEDRRTLNQQLIDSAARVRDVEASIDATRGRLKPLDAQETALRKSLDERRSAIVEILGRASARRPPAAACAFGAAGGRAEGRAHRDHARRHSSGHAQPSRCDFRRPCRPPHRAQGDRQRERAPRARSRCARARTAAHEYADRRTPEEAVADRSRRSKPSARAPPSSPARSTTSRTSSPSSKSALDPATRNAHAEARSIEEDATRPALAALKDPGRLAPAVAFAAMRGRICSSRLTVSKIRDFGGSDGVGGTQKGQSIAARAGAQITSPCDGWVVYAGPFRSYGQLLILNAGGGYHVLLAGMERISVDLGQFVLTGEPVAVMGNGSQVSAAGAARS